MTTETFTRIAADEGWVAVFGDVHGAWDAMYAYCQYGAPASQSLATAPVGLVLQCGDIGLFSASSPLDKATRRYSARDASELGAADFLRGTRPIPITTLFVRGNHEDFSLLPESGAGYVGAALGLYHIYRSPVRVIAGSHEITVAGVGGIARRGKHAPSELDDSPAPGKHITQTEVDALMGLSPGSVDILIAHDGPAGMALRFTEGAGSKTITALIRHLQPKLMFHGHYHHPPEPFRMGVTLCVCLNHPRGWRLPNRDGGMGLFDTETMEFEWAVPRESGCRG